MTKFKKRLRGIRQWAKGLEDRDPQIHLEGVPVFWRADLLKWWAEVVAAFPFVDDLWWEWHPDLTGAAHQYANRHVKSRRKPSRVEFFHEGGGHHLDATIEQTEDLIDIPQNGLTTHIGSRTFSKMPLWDQGKYARWFKTYCGLKKTKWAESRSLPKSHKERPNELFAEAVAAALMKRKGLAKFKGVIVNFLYLNWGRGRKALRMIKAMMREGE